MGMLDQRADVWLGVCEEFIHREYGKSNHLQRSLLGTDLNTRVSVVKEGGSLRFLNLNGPEWDVLEDDDMYINISHTGTVSVGYTFEGQADLGMFFKVGHPAEVSELFHLLLNPAAYVTPEEECEHMRRELGQLCKFHVLIPVGETWRIVDPMNMPVGTPSEFRKAFYLNLTRNWDHFVANETWEAWRFAERWPDFLKSLPVATDPLREGYIMGPDGDLLSAVDLAVIPPSGKEFHFDMLIVPNRECVSSMYLRERLNGDKGFGKQINNAFREGQDLDSMMTAIKSVSLLLPKEIRHQIRLAAEENAIREWFLGVANQIATQRSVNGGQRHKLWHLTHTLRQMLDGGE